MPKPSNSNNGSKRKTEQMQEINLVLITEKSFSEHFN